jgi:hypothetical protein
MADMKNAIETLFIWAGISCVAGAIHCAAESLARWLRGEK